MIIIFYGVILSIPVCVLVAAFSYWRMKRLKCVSWIDIIFRCAFSAYICLLFAVTFIGRPRLTGISYIPFSSYIEAWQSSSIIGWRNILINFIMFVPFGVLFPCVAKKQNTALKVLSSAVLFCFGIELAQMLTNSGVFEIDDIINNFVGALLGFFMFRKIRKKL